MESQIEDADIPEDEATTVTNSSPLELANAEMAAMLVQLKPLAKDHAMLRRRINELAVFADRFYPNRKECKAKADTKYNSTPEEEIFFEHRKQYEFLMTIIAECRSHIADCVKPTSKETIVALAECTGNLRALEDKAAKRLEAMNDILASLRKYLADKEQKMIGLLHDRAQLVQAAMFHKDKMEIARNAIENSGDIKQRLATKYGMTLEQIDQMEAAQPALLQEMDAVKDAG